MDNATRMPSIEKLLKLENVRMIHSVSDWKEAIHVSVMPLVEQGYCEARYIDGIIENTYKFGPYYVLCENLALIHASADKGVIKTQMAVTVLENPIKFKADGYDARVLIALGAKDSETHLSAMQAISSVFSDEQKVNKILTASDCKEVHEVFMTASDA